MHECLICQCPTDEADIICTECQRAEADSLSDALASATDEADAYRVLESHTLAWDAR